MHQGKMALSPLFTGGATEPHRGGMIDLPSVTQFISLRLPEQYTTDCTRGLNSRHLFVRVLEAEFQHPGTSRVSSAASLLGLRMAAFSLCPYTVFPPCTLIFGVPLCA